MAKRGALKVAILWHMHQPNYVEPHSNRLALPWVRLHALKDYVDMPLAAAQYDELKVTFNLVPSLIDQLQLYLNGGTDRHLELSRLHAADLTAQLKLEILRTFFSVNPSRMILPYPRYRELYQKHSSAGSETDTLVSLFSSEEIRDLQVWANLVWIDPVFRREEPVRSLFDKARHFTEEEKAALLDWEIDLIGRIVPTYQRLQQEGRLEVSFTPYYHPILPLLCDTDVATEALPSIDLPQKRFAHPEDARRQMAMSIEMYRSLFGCDMAGMWPSEGSVSEEVLEIASDLGVRWLATDEEVLAHSLTKSRLKHQDHPIHRVYQHATGLRLVFRDHALSDRIGFVYSNWEAPKAVADFIAHLKQIRSLYEGRLDRTVVPIILDGENAWEYFPDDATEFLDRLYRSLAEDEEIETVTVGEAVSVLEADSLPQIFAGSWINHNFRIWIGHPEDNAAWDLLGRTRDDLVAFEAENPDFDPARLAEAWGRVYMAEGSDWCWWYGDEHRSDQNEQFDRIFRQHLIAVYELTEREIPLEHLRPIYERREMLQAAMPDAMLTPEIDGRLTHFYEWAGAGFFDCRKSGGTMHQVQRHVTGIHFAYDRRSFHIRLDFRSIKELESIAGLKAVVTLFTPERRALELDLGERRGNGDEYRFALRDILELSIERDRLWSSGFGELNFAVALMQGDQQLECWPEHKPIRVDVPRRHEEMFWPA